MTINGTISKLPKELDAHITSYLPFEGAENFSRTAKKYHKNPSIQYWKTFAKAAQLFLERIPHLEAIDTHTLTRERGYSRIERHALSLASYLPRSLSTKCIQYIHNRRAARLQHHRDENTRLQNKSNQLLRTIPDCQRPDLGEDRINYSNFDEKGLHNLS